MGKGKAVIMDSGFCVFKGFIFMYYTEVYGSAVTKKCRYWT